MEQKPTSVQIDGLAVLKIIKHCQKTGPDVVTGQILGLEVEGTVEITNSFPSLGMDEKDGQDEYQAEMMKLLRTVNVDHNLVGWYQSSTNGRFMHQSIVQDHYNWQKAIPSSVLIVYDPELTKKGSLSLKAYRLKDDFMSFYATKDFSHINIAKHGIDSADIFEELPVKVHNSHLVHGFLYELQEKKNFSTEYDHLDLASGETLRRNLEIMSKCIDDLSMDQNKFLFQQRQVGRLKAQQQAFISKFEAENDTLVAMGKEPKKLDKSKNPLFKPYNYQSRLDTYLTMHKMNHYAQTTSSTIGQSLNKVFVADSSEQ